MQKEETVNEGIAEYGFIAGYSECDDFELSFINGRGPVLAP